MADTPEHQSAPGKGSGATLIRAVGTWGLAAAIANVTIGGGIFRLPAAAADTLGAAAPIAYIVCAVAMALIVLCIAEAGSRVTLTGGPYAYVEVAFGPYWGFITGVLLWLVGTVAVAGVANVFVDNVQRMFAATASPGGRIAVLTVAFAIAASINLVGVKQGNRLNLISTIAKLVPLLLLLGAGIFAIDSVKLEITTMPTAGDITRGSIFLIFAFAGIESALVPSGEVRDPARTVPRAIFIAMAGITVLYIGLQLVAQGVLGSLLATSSTPLAEAAEVVFGPWGKTMLLVGVIISTFGYICGMTLAVPRALFAFGRDGFLPRQIASIHPRWKTPYIAIVIQVVLTCTLAITAGFDKLAIIANVAALLVYMACALAAWQLRRKNVTSGGTPFRVPGAAVVPLLACAVIITLLTSITLAEWFVFVQVLVVATVIFFITRKHRQTLVQQSE